MRVPFPCSHTFAQNSGSGTLHELHQPSRCQGSQATHCVFLGLEFPSMGLLALSVRNEVKDSVFQGETSEETCQPVENSGSLQRSQPRAREQGFLVKWCI